MGKAMLILILVLGSILTTSAQTEIRYEDKLTLLNGSVIYGNLEKYSAEGEVTMLLKNGKRLVFKPEMIKKVKMKQSSLKSYFNYNDWYHSVHFALQSGNNGRRNNLRIGASMSYSGGYRFNQWLSIGLGTGWETYSAGSKEYFIPIYGEITSFLTERYKSPFIRIQAGGAVSYVKNDFIIESSGGWYIYPSFGWRLSGNDQLNYTLDFGLKMQQASFKYRGNGGWESIREQEIIFKRLSFRFGMLF